MNSQAKSHLYLSTLKRPYFLCGDHPSTMFPIGGHPKNYPPIGHQMQPPVVATMWGRTSLIRTHTTIKIFCLEMYSILTYRRWLVILCNLPIWPPCESIYTVHIFPSWFWEQSKQNHRLFSAPKVQMQNVLCITFRPMQ